jgi:hypothetical protein
MPTTVDISSAPPVERGAEHEERAGADEEQAAPAVDLQTDELLAADRAARRLGREAVRATDEQREDPEREQRQADDQDRALRERDALVIVVLCHRSVLSESGARPAVPGTTGRAGRNYGR